MTERQNVLHDEARCAWIRLEEIRWTEVHSDASDLVLDRGLSREVDGADASVLDVEDVVAWIGVDVQMNARYSGETLGDLIRNILRIAWTSRADDGDQHLAS